MLFISSFRITFVMHTIYAIVFIIVYRGDNMARFKIPNTPPTTNKCIRFPNDIIEQVEEAVRGENCTFTGFVVEAVRTALATLAEEAEQKKENNDA